MNCLFCYGRDALSRLQAVAEKDLSALVERCRKPFSRDGARGTSVRAAMAVAMCASLLLDIGSLHAAAQGESFPSKPVRIIAASGGSDLVARLVATQLNKEWGQGVVVDTRSGASGLITLDILAQSAPNGYSLALVTLSQMLSTVENQRRLLASEYQAVSFVGSTPFAIAVSASLPVNTLDEWIAHVKAQPGKLMFASAGQFTSSHVCLEEFNSRAGLNMLHVPYKASTAGMTAVISGQIQAICGSAGNAMAMAKVGKIRLLGSTYKEPTDLLPGVPPIASKLPGFEVLGWYGVIAPLNTPKDVVAKISADIAKAVKSPEMQQIFHNVGIRPDGTTPEQFSTFLKAETERWGKVLRASKANP
jgi:tripartite-type tricarboxylate transporter receptor subunit TctC